MKRLRLTLESPALNLALDEALLDEAENGAGEEILRYWEPKDQFLVLGISNRYRSELRLDAVLADKIPFFRRVSGGGTVYQGPGILNYSLILRHDSRGWATVSDANRAVMATLRAALARVSGREVGVSGITDLTIGARKVAGHAQRRRRRATLFHGSILLRASLQAMERYLALPAVRPAYRNDRSHTAFLFNLDLPAGAVEAAWDRAWDAKGDYPQPPLAVARRLATERYLRDDWTRKR